jgi:two-component system response regulator YesN
MKSEMGYNHSQDHQGRFMKDRLRVLIVDDELPVREELAAFDWEGHGAELAGLCESGEEALAFCGNTPVDLVISDITMPSMDGISLFSSLRQTYSGIQLIVLTCHKNFAYAQQMLQLGVLDYLIKVSMKDEDLTRLLDKAREAIEQNRLARIGAKEQSETFLSNNKRPMHPEIRLAQAYIDSHLKEDLSLLVVASSVGFSSYYLSRLFHSEAGIPFSEYVTERRVKKAEELLKTTTLKVYEVAEMVGFPNYRYFSMVFKRHLGYTPKKFRKT